MFYNPNHTDMYVVHFAAGDEPPPYGYIYHNISNIPIYMRIFKRTSNARPYDQMLLF